MACCRPSTIAKAHRGSSAYTISSEKMCAPKPKVGARDVRCLAIRVREVLISKEIASWAARSAFPKWQEGRHPHCHFRGLHRLHSVTARRIAQPPKATFVARLRPRQLPDQAARQLPDLSTIIRVRSSLTDDSRLRGALPN